MDPMDQAIWSASNPVAVLYDIAVHTVSIFA
jgi:hypothetical protein